jgi:hypothetical protein
VAQRPVVLAEVTLSRSSPERDGQRFCGKPRSIVLVLGSGQREVTTLALV